MYVLNIYSNLGHPSTHTHIKLFYKALTNNCGGLLKGQRSSTDIYGSENCFVLEE